MALTSLRADERLPSEHPRYFRVTAVRSHTVPIVDKFVERAKAVREWSASQRQGTDLIVQPKPLWSAVEYIANLLKL